MKQINITNIPIHIKCKNCGDCCGPIPVSETENNAIKKYLKDNPNIIHKLRLQKRKLFDCQFRDLEAKNCAIYEVRPLICKLFGVTKGMTCTYGNTCEIDGYQYMYNEKRKLIKKFY